ncbi:unnamed protein product [Larinioides sclopetarius]|uniref:Uncharacterized protein n=1 Tax=Larinioides sclopetarius TaxID=280406 RepID=A0AAV2APH5_9ARAC
MESGSGLSRSPALICKGFLLSVSMFVGFFGVFFSIWKDMHYAVPSFIFLEFAIRNDGSYFAFVPCLVSNLWCGLLIYESKRFIGMFDEQYGGSNLPYTLKN